MAHKDPELNDQYILDSMTDRLKNTVILANATIRYEVIGNGEGLEYVITDYQGSEVVRISSGLADELRRDGAKRHVVKLLRDLHGVMNMSVSSINEGNRIQRMHEMTEEILEISTALDFNIDLLTI